MFSRIFGNKPNKNAQKEGSLTTIVKLTETLTMLEKKESLLQKKASEEFERAKEFARIKNMRAAKQCLKRKRLYEQQIEQLGNFQLRIHDQMIMIEGAKATSETVEALRTGAAAMRSIHKTMNVNNVDKTIEEITQQTEDTRQIQEALAVPFTDFDEDELEAELEELESAGLEDELLQPANIGHTAPPRIPTTRHSTRPSKVDLRNDKDEEEEIVALQKAMAL
ncbi:unnamed protein product [Cuscuta epithymum]|uniref:Uncharacterized protein n=1 Tax=Cuscuta epithymum TaxID=186058 RepID=A0AAV0G7L2_9ASTE|nr:unnamed protein product [Cuscuta epithymum]